MYSFWDYLHSLWHKMYRDDILFLASGIAFNLLICLIPLILIIFGKWKTSGFLALGLVAGIVISMF